MRPLRSLMFAMQSRVKIARDPVAFARGIGVTVGEQCRFLGVKAGTFGSEPYLIRVGNHVTLTSGVRFVTHDGGVWVFRREYPDIDVFGSINIGNNVFIGINTIILPGVTIGDNTVIGAGSVVTKDIPSNSVAAGVPAKVLSPLESYRDKSLAKAHHIRSMSSARKREILTRDADLPSAMRE